MIILTLMLNAATAFAQTEVSRHFDGVLGTSFDLTVYGVEEGKLDAVLDELLLTANSMEQALSTYRSDSELMRLNIEKVSEQPSESLQLVLKNCLDWEERSQQKFSCRLGSLINFWNEAEHQQAIPDRIAVRSQARAIAEALVQIDTNSGITLANNVELDPSGLAKGYVIDQLMLFLRESLPQATAIKVDIGGDGSYWGRPPGQTGWHVGVADPIDTTDNMGFVAEFEIESMAIAASGHNSRFRTIERRQFSHILNPRDGWPVENGISAIVIAEDAMTADAVATALSVQSQADGIAWVNSMPDIEALVIASDGRQVNSEGWLNYSVKSSDLERANEKVLALNYVLPEFNVADYNRPYVAIWITGTDQKPLKNLLLLGETERWARENTRWWRRVGRRNPQLLDGVARSTRGAGEYTLQWNGIDDFGEVVADGDYLIHLEASRENGGSTYLNIPFTLGAEYQLTHLPKEGELGDINFEVNF